MDVKVGKTDVAARVIDASTGETNVAAWGADVTIFGTDMAVSRLKVFDVQNIPVKCKNAPAATKP